MTELILSEITRMKPGLCIIGIEPCPAGYRSVRPLPPRGHAWPVSFSYHRGDRLAFSLSRSGAPLRPHVEDCLSTGVPEKTGRATEEELRDHLRKAELARSVKELFRCQVRIRKRGAFAIGKLACRSICGVEAERVRLQWKAKEIRASVLLPSGEALPDLPVVDHSWHSFAEAALKQLQVPDRVLRLNSFLTARLEADRREGRKHFLRIGLTRPKPNACWLMVDTLFPLPRRSWLSELDGAPGTANPETT